MASKTVYMNESDNDEDDEYQLGDRVECSDDECVEEGQEYRDQEYPDFYENLEMISEQGSVQLAKKTEKKTRPRGTSFDSEISDQAKKPNVKCGSCKQPSVLEKNQKMIRCPHCGYRILFKLRTRNHVTYKTE